MGFISLKGVECTRGKWKLDDGEGKVRVKVLTLSCSYEESFVQRCYFT